VHMWCRNGYSLRRGLFASFDGLWRILVRKGRCGRVILSIDLFHDGLRWNRRHNVGLTQSIDQFLLCSSVTVPSSHDAVVVVVVVIARLIGGGTNFTTTTTTSAFLRGNKGKEPTYQEEPEE
jgi:hypothetical protein